MPPLSEREQKILEEIERGLYDEDPLFAQERRSFPIGSGARRAKLGAITFVVGLGLLIAFFATRSVFVGLLAFGGMVTGIVLLASPVSSLVSTTKGRAGQRRETFKRSLSDWEERIRKRYRRR